MEKKLVATGIVVEYNPFHNGHIYHIEKSIEMTQCDVLIAVMSPHFVQRGEPAILDKWVRTKAALNHGVDLVIELPTHIALQSAETFASGAIELLAMAHVKHVVYGSESIDKPVLSTIDKAVLDQGFSYAHAKNRDKHEPNQILGAYYERECAKYKIKTHIIQRTNAYHDESIHGDIASASAIRKAFYDHKPYHMTTPLNLSQHKTYNMAQAYPFIRYQILTQQKKIAHYLLVEEGIENLFIKLAKKHETYEAFLKEATSRRYTASRIRRTLCNILLETPKTIPEIESIRVLGMNQKGKAYLNQIKNDTNIVSSFKHYNFKDLEEKSTLIYMTLNPNKNPLLDLEVGPPIII